MSKKIKIKVGDNVRYHDVLCKVVGKNTINGKLIIRFPKGTQVLVSESKLIKE